MRAADALLRWYDRHRRDLPWRRTSDPYAIWLSEVMLQQTRVETVLPYYRRFLERFPTVADLAAAPLEELLALWSGLGYYRRARRLHAAARQIVAAGGFPTTVEGLRQLPGVGDYTAAAVASVAFGLAVPVLDGNAERVLCRLFAVAEEPRRQPVRRRLLAAAAELLDRERPGDSNQALMELGATLCSPRNPGCRQCPLSPACEARRQGAPERYPRRRRRRATVKVHRLVGLVKSEGRVLLFRRPDDAELLAGTWELPWVESDGGRRRGDFRPAAEHALAARYGGTWTVEEALASVRHGITHRALVVAVHRCRLAGGEEVAESRREAGWFDAAGRSRLPLSSLVEKVLAAAGG